MLESNALDFGEMHSELFQNAVDKGSLVLTFVCQVNTIIMLAYLSRNESNIFFCFISKGSFCAKQLCAGIKL